MTWLHDIPAFFGWLFSLVRDYPSESATVAIAAFAGATLYGGWRTRRGERSAAEAKAALHAYALRRQLLSWFETAKPSSDPKVREARLRTALAQWLHRQPSGRAFDDAERRVGNIVEVSQAISDDLRQVSEIVATTFYTATSRLSAYERMEAAQRASVEGEATISAAAFEVIMLISLLEKALVRRTYISIEAMFDTMRPLGSAVILEGFYEELDKEIAAREPTLLRVERWARYRLYWMVRWRPWRSIERLSRSRRHAARSDEQDGDTAGVQEKATSPPEQTPAPEKP